MISALGGLIDRLDSLLAMIAPIWRCTAVSSREVAELALEHGALAEVFAQAHCARQCVDPSATLEFTPSDDRVESLRIHRQPHLPARSCWRLARSPRELTDVVVGVPRDPRGG